MTHEESNGLESRLVLEDLSVDNLRSLQSLPAVPLEPGLTVLAGQNGGGKTSFIDALTMLLAASSPREEAQSSPGSGISVEGTFAAVDTTDRWRVRAVSSGGRVSRQLLRKVHPQFGKPPADMNINELRKAIDDAGVDSPGGTAKAPLIEAATEWIDQQPAEELRDDWADLPKDIEARLPQLTVFHSHDAADQPNHVRRLVSDASQRLLDAEPLASQLDNIARDIQDGVDPLLETIRDMILRYCPGIVDVTISPRFDFTRVNPQLQIDLKKTGGESVDLGEVGSGVSQRVGLAMYAANHETLRQSPDQSVGSLLAYDEPDTHLDYQAQRELYNIIREQSELSHVQVVVATHSINLIDKVSIQALRHFRLDNENTVVELPSDYSHELESEFVEDLASGLGLRNSVLLSERCFLVVEGETEERALPILFRKVASESLASAGVTLLNTGGSGSVRAFVETLVQKLKRAVVVLADEDARDSAKRLNSQWLERMGLKEGESGFFVGEKEFEDAFEDATWLRVANEAFPLDDGTEWSSDEFALARDDKNGMGQALENLFSRRLRRRVTKPEIGVALARAVASEELPEAIEAAIQAAWNRSKEN